MYLLAGPCLIESFEVVDKVASKIVPYCKEKGITLFLKGSYRKANRTSHGSFEGIGDEKALGILKEVGEKHGVRTITDVHSVEEVALADKYVDALQIPAFLARQTDLLIAAGNTGKPINLKKGQFMSPYDMIKAGEKIASTGNKHYALCERGTFFGYNDLVVDYRSLSIMKNAGQVVVYDATHSLQRPSLGKESGGYRELIPALARAAVACGIDGLFLETHPDPANAKSDSATQLPLDEFPSFMDMLLKVESAVRPYTNPVM